MFVFGHFDQKNDKWNGTDIKLSFWIMQVLDEFFGNFFFGTMFRTVFWGQLFYLGYECNAEFQVKLFFFKLQVRFYQLLKMISNSMDGPLRPEFMLKIQTMILCLVRIILGLGV